MGWMDWMGVVWSGDISSSFVISIGHSNDARSSDKPTDHWLTDGPLVNSCNVSIGQTDRGEN